MVKRIFDIFLSLICLSFFSFIMILITLMILFTSKRNVLYWSKRVGKNNNFFKMPKFRTMLLKTPEVASDKIYNPESFYTPIGEYLRHYSLDELPQLFSILKGDMSFVGPRPALYNQNELIKMRTEKKIHLLMPGLTGWAQVNGRDKISIFEKVKLDFEYSKNQTFWFDIKILLMTFKKIFIKEDISH